MSVIIIGCSGVGYMLLLLFFSLHTSSSIPLFVLTPVVTHFSPHSTLYILSTGLNPNSLIPLFSTCLAATYSANRAAITSLSLPTTIKFS
jgi:hypothetical protein